MFFLALLPQFVEVGRGSVTAQFAILGLIIMGAGLVVGLALAVGAGYMHDSFRRNERLSRMQRWLTGGLFIGLGVRLALSKRGA